MGYREALPLLVEVEVGSCVFFFKLFSKIAFPALSFFVLFTIVCLKPAKVNLLESGVTNSHVTPSEPGVALGVSRE